MDMGVMLALAGGYILVFCISQLLLKKLYEYKEQLLRNQEQKSTYSVRSFMELVVFRINKQYGKEIAVSYTHLGMRWLEFTGNAVELTESQIENKKESYQATLDQNGIVLDRSAFPPWENEERMQLETEIASEFTNVDPADYADYYSFEGVEIKPEEPVACQQLYARCV